MQRSGIRLRKVTEVDGPAKDLRGHEGTQKHIKERKGTLIVPGLFADSRFERRISETNEWTDWHRRRGSFAAKRTKTKSREYEQSNSHRTSG
jgi:fructose 1,6-bisphosphatase